MTLYISFPVGLFLLFNYPPFYEKTILEGRRKLAASYDVKGAQMLEEMFKERKRKEMEEKVQELKSKGQWLYGKRNKDVTKFSGIVGFLLYFLSAVD